jgi:hypothetical protein
MIERWTNKPYMNLAIAQSFNLLGCVISNSKSKIKTGQTIIIALTAITLEEE